MEIVNEIVTVMQDLCMDYFFRAKLSNKINNIMLKISGRKSIQLANMVHRWSSFVYDFVVWHILVCEIVLTSGQNSDKHHIFHIFFAMIEVYVWCSGCYDWTVLHSLLFFCLFFGACFFRTWFHMKFVLENVHVEKYSCS